MVFLYQKVIIYDITKKKNRKINGSNQYMIIIIYYYFIQNFDYTFFSKYKLYIFYM